MICACLFVCLYLCLSLFLLLCVFMFFFVAKLCPFSSLQDAVIAAGSTLDAGEIIVGNCKVNLSEFRGKRLNDDNSIEYFSENVESCQFKNTSSSSSPDFFDVLDDLDMSDYTTQEQHHSLSENAKTSSVVVGEEMHVTDNDDNASSSAFLSLSSKDRGKAELPLASVLLRPFYTNPLWCPAALSNQASVQEYFRPMNPAVTDSNQVEIAGYGDVDRGMCMSLHQPWASLVVHGIKRFEGRGWSTPYRGRLWIASTSRDTEDEEVQQLESEYRDVYGPNTPFPKSYPVGCLLGYVDLVDCWSDAQFDNYYRAYGPQSTHGFPVESNESKFVFVCANAHVMNTPFTMTGNHKIFSLPPHVRRMLTLGAKHGLTRPANEDWLRDILRKIQEQKDPNFRRGKSKKGAATIQSTRLTIEDIQKQKGVQLLDVSNTKKR